MCLLWDRKQRTIPLHVNGVTWGESRRHKPYEWHNFYCLYGFCIDESEDRVDLIAEERPAWRFRATISQVRWFYCVLIAKLRTVAVSGPGKAPRDSMQRNAAGTERGSSISALFLRHPLQHLLYHHPLPIHHTPLILFSPPLFYSLSSIAVLYGHSLFFIWGMRMHTCLKLRNLQIFTACNINRHLKLFSINKFRIITYQHDVDQQTTKINVTLSTKYWQIIS